MRNLIGKTKGTNMKAVCVAVLIMATAITVSAADYQWSFSTSDNPSYSSGVAATVTTGDFSTGWWDTFLGLQTSGFWDLGSGGTIDLNTSGSASTVTVQTVEWIDGWIYGSYATVSFSGGATLQSEDFDLVEQHPSFFGAWMLHTQVFSVSSLSAATITGAYYGSLVEYVSVTSN